MGAAYTGAEENLRLPTERGIHSDLWRPFGWHCRVQCEGDIFHIGFCAIVIAL